MATRDLAEPAPPTTFVRVLDDRVLKGSVDDPAIEALKVEALHELSTAHGFRAPALLSVDVDGGLLTLERVPITTPLALLTHDPERRTSRAAAEAFREAGRVLGVLHEGLDVGPSTTVALPRPISDLLPIEARERLWAECAAGSVVSHGDYGTSNLFVADDGELTVLDPLPNEYSSFRSVERGSRYLDLALFDTCLLGRGPLRTFMSARPRPMVDLLHEFLEGYRCATGVTVDVGLLRMVSRAVLQSYLQIRRGAPEAIASVTASLVISRQERALMTPTADVSYRQSHTQAGYGLYYDDTMFSGYFGDVWLREERPVLAAWLGEERDAGAERAIDLACGTGRITEVVAGEIPTVLGIDISAEMLAQASQRCDGVQFLERDVTTAGVADLAPADVATAFRFFMNAEPELRAAVLDRLHEVLRPGGVLITNVQCNSEAPAGLVQRLRRRVLGHSVTAMSHAEMTRLLRDHGFAVERTEWMAYWPRTGPYLAGVARRLQRPARQVARVLRLPDRRVAGMFMVRARRV